MVDSSRGEDAARDHRCISSTSRSAAPLFFCFHSAIPRLAISRSSTSSTPDRLTREVEEGPDFCNRALTLKSRPRSSEVLSRRWTWSWSRERKPWRTRLRRRPANLQPRRRPTSLTRTSALTGPPALTRRSGSYSSLTFAISTFTAWYGWYIPDRQVVGTRTAHYRAVPPKIDRRQSISTVGDRLKGEIDRRRSIEGEIDRRRSIEREKGKKKKRKKKKKKEKRRKRIPIARARSSPVHRRCPRVVGARGSRALFLPRGEKDRGDDFYLQEPCLLSHIRIYNKSVLEWEISVGLRFKLRSKSGLKKKSAGTVEYPFCENFQLLTSG
ncbi:hypothetical protein GW17_00002220 [Ensete ventricosum]|nr:hypothetical protein GW17_00002220 [Ensete ventricosum]